jgi:DNA-binding NtrC family response regulator
MAGGSTVLVVDDNGCSRKFLGDIVRGSGFCVCEFSSAEDCLKAVGNISFAALISDFNLGLGMSGMQLIARFRKFFPEAPCLLVSTDDKVGDLAKQEGCRFLFKFDSEGIKDFLRSVSCEPKKKRAAVVAIADPEKEREVIRELEAQGVVVHVPFESAPDKFGAEELRLLLLPAYEGGVEVYV